jgi:hypothetical protein
MICEDGLSPFVQSQSPKHPAPDQTPARREDAWRVSTTSMIMVTIIT